jgi:hypothetical protein
LNASGDGGAGDTTPPAITNATAIDRTDGDGVVTSGDLIEIRAFITDNGSGVFRVGAFPEVFGANEVVLTGADEDLYTGTFVVGSDFPVAEGGFPIRIVAEDNAENLADVPTNELQVNTSEEPGGLSGFINGTVTDATGASVPGLEIIAVDESTDRPQFATTDMDGTYSMAVPAGNYSVIVDSPAFEFERVRGVEVIANATRVVDFTLNETIAPGDGVAPTVSAEAIDRTDNDGAVSEGDLVEVRAIVTDPDGDLDGVVAFADPFGVEEITLTSAGGDLYNASFSVNGTAAVPRNGEYEIFVSAEDTAGNVNETLTNRLFLNVSGTGDTTLPRITDARAIDRTNTDRTVSDGDLIEVRATVTDTEGSIVRVSTFPEAFGIGELVLTRAGGPGDDVYNATFRVDGESAVPDGEYPIPLIAEDDAGNIGEGRTNQLELNVTGEEPIDDDTRPVVTDVRAIDRTNTDRTVSDGDLVEVRATVTDADSGVEDVVVFPDAFGVGELALTSASGDVYNATFQVDERFAAPSGSYSIGIIARDEAGNVGEAATDELRLAVSGRTTGVLEGTITNDTGAPVGGIELVVVNPSTGESTSVVPDSRGSYSVELPTGTYDVVVDQPGYQFDRLAGRTVSENETTEVDIVLNETSDTGDALGLASGVRLAPASQAVGASETTTFDLVVEDVTGGVGAYTATVSMDPSVAGVTDVQLLGNPGQQTVDIAADNGSVTIDTALMDTADTGPVTVARITVEGNASGATAVNLGVSALGNETGSDYQVTNVDGASLTVAAAPKIGGFDNAPTDPDGDGFHEDINGNGEVNVVDVQAMFANRDDSALAENPQLFDFSGNDEVDIVDVQALFAELTD